MAKEKTAKKSAKEKTKLKDLSDRQKDALFEAVINKADKKIGIRRGPKEVICFRADPLVNICLEELCKNPDIVFGEDRTAGIDTVDLVAEKYTKGDYIHTIFALYIWRHLMGAISEKQVEGYRYTPELFRLFIMYIRAKRGDEGYGFTTDDKETRFVYGPPL